MSIRIVGFLLAITVLSAPGNGINGGASLAAAEVERRPDPASPTAAHLHWLGMNRIAQETNAAGFMEVWNLPESRRLKDQTLDKLALFLARAHLTNSVPPRTNYQDLVQGSRGAMLWRPVLDGLITEESFLEVGTSAEGQYEIGLALRLAPARSSRWETSLADALAATPGATSLPPSNGGRCWQLPTGRKLTLTRAGAWTLLGLGRQPDSTLVKDLAARINRDQQPFKPSSTNFWVEASVDLMKLLGNQLADWRPPSGWPAITLTAIGAGDCVYERAKVVFPKPLEKDLGRWQLPTNFICGPISSFSAARRLKPWLGNLPAWNALNLGNPPEQLYAWAIQGLPMFSYLAAVQPDATNQVNRLADLILTSARSWLETNDTFKIERMQDAPGLRWKGPPYASPFIIPAGGQTSFVLLGTAPPNGTNQPLPAELLSALEPTNLLAYSWEFTSMRLEQWVFLSQFARLVGGRAQLPPESAGLRWLRAVAPHLGMTTLAANLTQPAEVSIVRRSTLGTSSLELHLLTDWLESPNLPEGMFTLLTPDFFFEWPAQGKRPERAPK